ncbi:MAG: D-2-hydroxyacid dehydrogenase [Bacillota bacterium]
MKIVILESRALQSEDPQRWEPFEALGELVRYDLTRPDQLIERAKGAEAIIVNKVPIQKQHFAQLPYLKYIGVVATGYDPIDVQEARARGIVVSNVPAYATEAVAQHCAALLLALCRQAETYNRGVQEGRWSRCDFFSFWDRGLIDLTGMTYGAIGFGATGRATARIMHAMGMRILAYRRNPCDETEFARFAWAKSADEVFEKADVVSLHCPLTLDPAGIVNARTLGLMKKTAFLLNTARGGLVVDQELADALCSGVIAGAGLDVLSTEPPKAPNPLIGARNCIITPHIAWISQHTLECLYNTVLNNLRAFLNGKPVNVVN